jgi:prolyl 4-hydroxylase
MSEQVITEELRSWIVAQAEAGHAAQAVLDAMKLSGWQEEVAIAAMEEVMRLHVAQRGLDPGRTLPDLSESRSARVWAHDRWVYVVMDMVHPRVVVLGGFLGSDECQGLIELAQPRLTRSLTVVNETGTSAVNAARTSQGMFFERGENELCARIEARIAALLNWPVERGEGLQVLRYAAGAEYRPHYDYFDPAQPGTSAILRRGGQRVGTMVMYLNTPGQGGATVFPDVGLSVQAVAGNAVFFSYGQPHPSTRTLHGGAVVQGGEKWVATKWMREERFV